MKRNFLLLYFFIVFIAASAQNISVKSFQLLPTDMTASSLEGKKTDRNGDVAALIKVVTTETGFTFEGGTLGIVDTKERNGEIWVWVPRASRKITILHRQLGVLRDYRFPVEIESERTYEMVLTTAKIETFVKEEVTMQYLAFKITPPNAILEVNDQLWTLEADGTAMKYVEFGTYEYRVRASDYLTDVGKVTVNDPDSTKVVNVSLKSNSSIVTLKVDADAEIWVNNEKKGVRNWTGPLGDGTYKIECKQAGHETTSISKKITAEMNGQTITLPVPKPVYGSLLVESNPNFSKLNIDGKDHGLTPKAINEILVGQHKIIISHNGYHDFEETITISQGKQQQVKAMLKQREGEEAVDEANVKTTTDSGKQKSSHKFNWGWKAGYQTHNNYNTDASFMNHFAVGLFSRFDVGKMFIQPEVLYYKSSNLFYFDLSSNIAGIILDNKARYYFNSLNLQIPVLIGFQVLDLGFLKYRTQIGPSASFVLKHSNILEYNGNNETVDFGTRKVLIGCHMCIGVDLGRFSLDVNYNYGLSTLFQSVPQSSIYSSLENVKRNHFMVTLGIEVL